MQKGNNDKFSDIITKIKNIKNIKIIIGVLFVAVALLIYSSVSNVDIVDKNTLNTENVTINNAKYTDDEEKLADILSQIDGIGQTKVMISYTNDKTVNGVIVVSRGADKPLAEWQIRHAVQTALKIDYHSIEVYSMN